MNKYIVVILIPLLCNCSFKKEQQKKEELTEMLFSVQSPLTKEQLFYHANEKAIQSIVLDSCENLLEQLLKIKGVKAESHKLHHRRVFDPSIYEDLLLYTWDELIVNKKQLKYKDCIEFYFFTIEHKNQSVSPLDSLCKRLLDVDLEFKAFTRRGMQHCIATHHEQNFLMLFQGKEKNKAFAIDIPPNFACKTNLYPIVEELRSSLPYNMLYWPRFDPCVTSETQKKLQEDNNTNHKTSISLGIYDSIFSLISLTASREKKTGYTVFERYSEELFSDFFGIKDLNAEHRFFEMKNYHFEFVVHTVTSNDTNKVVLEHILNNLGKTKLEITEEKNFDRGAYLMFQTSKPHKAYVIEINFTSCMMSEKDVIVRKNEIHDFLSVFDKGDFIYCPAYAPVKLKHNYKKIR